ncbi:MAG: hypothetical protein AB1449_13330 [Chloroflexota bacterium]
MAVVHGPAGCGKLAGLRRLTGLLAGNDPLRFQEMLGHAWWASRSPSVALFTEAPRRFNCDKLLALVEEAALTESPCRVFIALVERISPAELSCLAELAVQARRGWVSHLLGTKLETPVPVPANLLLLATLDDIRPQRWETDLLAGAWIVHCNPTSACRLVFPAAGTPVVDGSSIFLQSMVREPHAALRRPRRIPGWHPAVLSPLIAMVRLLEAYRLPASRFAVGEVLVYLANAWTLEGEGLFNRSFAANMRAAFDHALTYAIVPRLQARDGPVQEVAKALASTLGKGCPGMAAALAACMSPERLASGRGGLRVW